MPQSKEIRVSLGQQLFKWTIESGKKIVILTEAIVLLVFISRFKLDRDTNRLRERIENKQAIVKSTQKLETEHRRIQRKLNRIKLITREQIDWNKRLDSFTQKMPQDVTLENLSLDHNSIALSAKVKTAASFGTFIKLLLQDDNTQAVFLKSSSYNKQEKNYKFSLDIRVIDNNF